ncbi:hypothetical protein EDC04DRAFT_2609809 [Pisolithus marmoratus]|nr:hypothetical protein EDC04DRAFT_2609809 [Pisolithus marmoratus]
MYKLRLSVVSYLSELDIEQGEEPDHGRSIDFGDPDQAQLWDLFKNGLMGDPPTEDEHRNLEHAGLAKADTKDDGSFAGTPHVGQYTVDMIDLLEVSWYPHAGHDVQPYTSRPPYPSQQSMIEMAIIHWGLQIECAVVHLLTILRVSDWPTQWFYNLCLDLDEIQNTPLGAFQMIDSLDHYIPEWTPQAPNNTSSQFPIFSKLYLLTIHQYKWPTKNSSMGDQIDDWIKGKVHNFMTDLWGVTEQIEVNKQDLNHLCSQWAALSRLLGRQDVA